MLQKWYLSALLASQMPLEDFEGILSYGFKQGCMTDDATSIISEAVRSRNIYIYIEIYEELKGTKQGDTPA